MLNISVDGAEEWRPVVGWEASHLVSSHGRVMSIPRANSRGIPVLERIHKQQVDKWGYHYLFLHCNGRKSTRNVHVLVAGAFIGPRPEGYDTDHVDGNKGNNRADNLRYVTKSENVRARMATGCGVGDRNPKAKLRAEWVNIIRRLHREGLSMAKIGRAFGVSDQAIFGVISGRCWSHVQEDAA